MKFFWTVLATLLLSLTLSSCGGSESPSDPVPVSKKIYGLVELDGPVANAEVVVTDLNSTVIARGKTSDKGVFNLATEGAHSDFNVSATGGVSNSVPVKGTLHAAVRARHPLGRVTPVNPATTLLKMRMEQRTSGGYDTAVADVKKYLGVPRTHGLGYDLTADIFSGAVFRASADQAGGLDAYLATLATEMAMGKKHSFAAPAGTVVKSVMLKADAEGSIARTIATGVLNGVLGRIGAEGFDSILSLATGARALSADSQALAALAASAARQEAKLEEISTEVNALAAQLVTLTDDVLQRIEKDTYLSAEAAATKDMLIFNQHVTGELRFISTLADTDGQIQKNLDEFIENSLKTTDLMAGWSLALRGGANPTGGLIVRWNRVVTAERPDVFDETEAQRIQTHWDWYDGMQSQTLLHIMDYKRSKPEKYSAASMAFEIDALRVERQAQMAMLRGHVRLIDIYPRQTSDGGVTTDFIPSDHHLPPNAVIDRTTGATMWMRKPVASNVDFTTFYKVPPPGQILTGVDEFWQQVQWQAERQSSSKWEWRLPHTQEAKWSDTDLTGFARLRKLGIDIPDPVKIFYRDTYAERQQRALQRNCYYNPVPGQPCDAGPDFYRNWMVKNLRDCLFVVNSFAPLLGAGQQLSMTLYPDALERPNALNLPFGMKGCSRMDLSEDDSGKYWFNMPDGRSETYGTVYTYDPSQVLFNVYLTRDASDYFY